jgi:hypothetical protein
MPVERLISSAERKMNKVFVMGQYGLPRYMKIDTNKKRVDHVQLFKDKGIGNVNIYAAYDLSKVSGHLDMCFAVFSRNGFVWYWFWVQDCIGLNL